MYISLDWIVFEGLILKVAVVVAELTFHFVKPEFSEVWFGIGTEFPNKSF